ncbi:MAG: hypothetical protein LBE59_06200 [Nevskiaceae bacterium]|nr:hypothetical protein [Nevskiaceae bacterium]
MWFLFHYTPTRIRVGESLHLTRSVEPIYILPDELQPSKSPPMDISSPTRMEEFPVPLAPLPDLANPSTAITLPIQTAEPIDWEREATISAKSWAQSQVEKENPLNSRPKVLELPARTGASGRVGEVQTSPDGTVGVWTSDDVYCESRHLLIDQFNPMAAYVPPACHKISKPKPNLSFERTR